MSVEKIESFDRLLVSLGYNQDPFYGHLYNERYYFLDSTRNAIYKCIINQVPNGTGLFFLEGETGVGKTSFVHYLSQRVKYAKNIPVVSVYVGKAQSFSTTFLTEIGFDDFAEEKLVRNKDRIQRKLYKLMDHHQQLVVIIDGVEEISDNGLQLLRTIYKMSSIKNRKMVIVLTGTQFQGTAYEELESAIDVREITPFSLKDMSEMLKFRCHVAGGSLRFSRKALEALHWETDGYPGKFLKTCRFATTLLYDEGKYFVDEAEMEFALSVA